MGKRELEDMVVLISGGCGRLGSEFAKTIVQEGGKVCLFDIIDVPKDLFQKEIENSRAVVFKGNATSGQDIDAAIEKCKEAFGKLDAAVHCAYPTSRQWGTPFENLELAELGQDLSMQLGGAIIFSQRLIESFRCDGGGALIHLSSIQGIAAPRFWHYEDTPMVSPIEYSAIKSGVIAITRYLAKYCKGENIRVNCISPGGILNDQPLEFLRRYQRSCNSKGMLDSEDVSGALVFLLSNRSKFISGQNFVVDDGWSL
jgi:NAD(P)-dependent dehydrogenase (short-subunit alcohol dehydrogenase family)